MIVFPPCKINIGLRILDKRPDGFHNLETIFLPIPHYDALEIIPATAPQQWPVQYSQSGIKVYSSPADNLCVKAWHLLKAQFSHLPQVVMHLHKAIPIGAGLGGGSADGAYSIRLLNQLFSLGLSAAELITLSLQLGSDCPFFIYNVPCHATGRGEQLTPLPLLLSGYQLLLINPGIHVNTGWAFAELSKARQVGHQKDDASIDLTQLANVPLSQWKNTVVNHFEAPVFAAYPQLQKLKEELYLQGAVYAAMSGSGSTFYGIFEKNNVKLAAFNHWPFVKLFNL
jgi:4-diphosphocytidyl-2-C-methyl-D-erythritol kinase